MEEGTVSQALEAGKDKETDSLLEPPQRLWPCQHLAFNPMELPLNFWPSKLEDNINYSLTDIPQYFSYFIRAPPRLFSFYSPLQNVNSIRTMIQSNCSSNS